MMHFLDAVTFDDIDAAYPEGRWLAERLDMFAKDVKNAADELTAKTIIGSSAVLSSLMIGDNWDGYEFQLDQNASCIRFE